MSHSVVAGRAGTVFGHAMRVVNRARLAAFGFITALALSACNDPTHPAIGQVSRDMKLATALSSGPAYIVKDQGTVEGPAYLSNLYAVNTQGWSVGWSEFALTGLNGAGQSLCACGKKPNGIWFGVPDSTQNFDVGYAISESETIVGATGQDLEDSQLNLYSPILGHAFIGSARSAVGNLGELPGGSFSRARSINQRGDVVGASYGSDGIIHPVIWPLGGSPADLHSLPGTGLRGEATGINDRGEISGFSFLSTGYYHAVRWTAPGAITDLGTLGGTGSYAYHINNSGHIVGWATDSAEHLHAVVWTSSSGARDLGILPGDTLSEAFGIDDNDDVVGASYGPAGAHGFIWNATGGMRRLPDLDSATGAVFTVANAAASSSTAGVLIVGLSIAPSGYTHGVSWQSNTSTGSLAVTISAPEGVTPAVTVTGPRGYRRTFSTTTTLAGLPGGAYTVRAAKVVERDPIRRTVYTSVVVGSPATVSVGYTDTATVTYSAKAAR